MKLENKDYVFVGIQFVLFVIYIFNLNLLVIDISPVIDILGIILSILGILILLIALLQLNKNLSPFPTPISGGSLIKTGLYKYIRHPIYTGILFTLGGYAVYVNSTYKLIITLALFVLFFFKSKYEEKKLSKVFKKYSTYKLETGRFLPKFF